MNIPIRNIYYLLAYAWRYIDVIRDRDAEGAPVDSLPNLLAFVLARRTAALLTRGLDRSYVEENIVLAGVRGRLDLATTVKRNLLRQLRTACTVEELRHDVLHNQILRATLRRLLMLVDLAADVRERVGLIYRRLDGVSDIQDLRSSFRRVQIHRNNRAYEFLMNLCRLIHDSLQVDEDGSARFADIRRQPHVMNRLFEDFVANFYRVEQSRYEVASQTPWPWHEASSADAQDLNRLPRMIPDVILTNPSRRIILDTKFYRQPLKEGRFGGRQVRSSHLYQIFTYIENGNARLPTGPHHEGLLLYPVVRDAFRFDFRLKGHRVQVRTIDLDQDWWQIRKDMLGLLEVT